MRSEIIPSLFAKETGFFLLHRALMREHYSTFMMYLLRMPVSYFFQTLRNGSESRIFVALAIAISITFLISSFVHRSPPSAKADEGLPGIPETGQATVALAATTTKKIADEDLPMKIAEPMRAMHIANNGAVYLRGARIEALHDSSIEVRSKWGSMDFVWDVKTGIGTKYVNARGETMRESALKVGDIVAVTGVLDQSADTPSMRAQYIRISVPQK
jgi:hypothetical protein